MSLWKISVLGLIEVTENEAHTGSKLLSFAVLCYARLRPDLKMLVQLFSAFSGL